MLLRIKNSQDDPSKRSYWTRKPLDLSLHRNPKTPKKVQNHKNASKTTSPDWEPPRFGQICPSNPWLGHFSPKQFKSYCMKNGR
jgi:hypothetical protein